MTKVVTCWGRDVVTMWDLQPDIEPKSLIFCTCHIEVQKSWRTSTLGKVGGFITTEFDVKNEDVRRWVGRHGKIRLAEKRIWGWWDGGGFGIRLKSRIAHSLHIEEDVN